MLRNNPAATPHLQRAIVMLSIAAVQDQMSQLEISRRTQSLSLSRSECPS
uniref:Uncharacterized protein n=1 Tax=Arundo donax TaxID=35708 RepID=A0A0A9HY61_ARUDO